jgi:predicted extracellular nuclease
MAAALEHLSTADESYTYDFDGVSEVLDHILITKGIGTFTYQVVHVNAEFANQVSDHDPQVVDIKPSPRYPAGRPGGLGRAGDAETRQVGGE